MIYVIGPKDPQDPRVKEAINTTSCSKNWSKGLSPFFLGPTSLFGCKNRVAQNVENAWQFTKVYSEHISENGTPSKAYFHWAKQGFADSYAHRYPMGKGRKPKYSWWNGKKMTYIEARKAIYIPLYSEAVSKTKAYKQLQAEHDKSKDIWLWDFDGYNHRNLNMTWEEVINNEDYKMGHAFVLAMLLEGVLPQN